MSAATHRVSRAGPGLLEWRYMSRPMSNTRTEWVSAPTAR